MRLWVDCLTVPLREAYDSSVAGGDHIKMRENMRSQHVRNTAEKRGQNTLSQGPCRWGCSVLRRLTRELFIVQVSLFRRPVLRYFLHLSSNEPVWGSDWTTGRRWMGCTNAQKEQESECLAHCFLVLLNPMNPQSWCSNTLVKLPKWNAVIQCQLAACWNDRRCVKKSRTHHQDL